MRRKKMNLLVYQQALDLLAEAKNRELFIKIAEHKRIRSAGWSSHQEFRIVTDISFTTEIAKNHAAKFGIEWTELKPFLCEAEKYWNSVAKEGLSET